MLPNSEKNKFRTVYLIEQENNLSDPVEALETARSKSMKNRYLILLTTLTFLGFSAAAPAHDCSRHQDQNHKHCDSGGSGGGGAITYTAELTEGAFDFDVIVAPNSRENGLLSSEDLYMVRPGEPDNGVCLASDTRDECLTWNDVFNTCAVLLAQNSVTDIFVLNDDWSIEKAGGVRVIFRDIRLQGAEVTVQLIGNEFEFSEPFIPVPDDAPGSTATRTFDLDQAAIYGKSVKGGGGPRQGCQPSGGGGFDIFPLLHVDSVLVITATRE
jgi:hypothetical protein